MKTIEPSKVVYST